MRTTRTARPSHLSQGGRPRLGRRWGTLVLLAVAHLGVIASIAAAQGPLDDLGPLLEEAEPIDLAFPEAHSSHQIYRALERAFDVQITLDRALPDERVQLEMRSVRLPEALDALNEKLGSFHVVKGPRAVTVAPDTPAYRRRHEPHYMARFRLRDVDPATAMNSLRALVDVRKIAMDEASSTLIIRGTGPTVQHAARVLEDLDQPQGTTELQVELFLVDSVDELLGFDATLGTSTARDALSARGAQPVLRQKASLAVGSQGRIEAASQPYVGKELGWEGLVVEKRVRISSVDDRSLTLEVRVQGACLRPTLDGALRRDHREQSLQARLNAGQSLLVLEPIPSATGPIEGRGTTCGLLPEPAEERAHFVLLLTPTLRPAAFRPLEAEAWLVGTETGLEDQPQPTQSSDSSR